MMDYQALAVRLTELRQAQGISQQQLAQAIGVSRATVNALEKGHAGDVGIKKVMRIVDYLGVELCLRPKSPFPTLEELMAEHDPY